MDQEELDNIKKKVEPCLRTVMESQDLDMMFMMMTNIVENNTELLCCGPMADEMVREAFDIPEEAERIILKGIVSRKKQFLPPFAEAFQNNG